MLAYFTGMRLGDLFSIRIDDIDLENREIHFTAKKTRKAAIFPLHRVAIEHIRRVWSERKLLLTIDPKQYYDGWRSIVEQSGIKGFTLHDLRRTGASEVERVRSGMGTVFLQHTPMLVTNTFYLNFSEELRESVDAMRVPDAFVDDQFSKDRELVLPIQAPNPDDWNFREPSGRRQPIYQYWFRGEWRAVASRAGFVLLKFLATTGQPVSFEEISEALTAEPNPVCSGSRKGCHQVLRRLRLTLRAEFQLPESMNPIPYFKTDFGGRWTLTLDLPSADNG